MSKVNDEAQTVQDIAKATKNENNMRDNGRHISVETAMTNGWINKKTGLVTAKFAKDMERLAKAKQRKEDAEAKEKADKIQAKEDAKAKKIADAEKAEAKLKSDAEKAKAKETAKAEREEAKALKDAQAVIDKEAKAKERADAKKINDDAKAKIKADAKIAKDAEKALKDEAKAKLAKEKAEAKEKVNAEKAKIKAEAQKIKDDNAKARKDKREAKELEATKKAELLASMQAEAESLGLPIPTRLPRKPIEAQILEANDGSVIKSPYDLNRRSGYKTIWQVLAERHDTVVTNEELHAEVNKRLATESDSSEWYASKYSSLKDDLGHAKEYPAVKNATDVMTRAPYNGVSKVEDKIVIDPVSLEGLGQRIIAGKSGVMLSTSNDSEYVFNKRSKKSEVKELETTEEVATAE
jgi:hypothetical protein